MKQTKKVKIKPRNYLIPELFSGKYSAKVAENEKEKMKDRKRNRKVIADGLKEMDSDDLVVA